VEAAPRGAIHPRSFDAARQFAGAWALPGLLGLVGVVNFVVLLAQARALVHSLYLNADNASALVLPALAGHAPPGSVVNIGNHPWYEPWWFMRATASLPGYRALWEAAPIVLGLLGSAAVAACAWWALGRLAGLVCGAVLLSASAAQRSVLYVPESHGLIVIHVAVLCAALLFVQRRAHRGRLPLRTLLLVGVPLTLFTAAGLTDQLLIVSGLGPFVLAPLVCWLRFRSRTWMTVSAFAVVTGIVSLMLALLVTHVMQDRGVVHAPFPVSFVGSEAMLAGAQNLLATLAWLGGGSFFGLPASGGNLFTFGAGVLTLVAFAEILRALWRWRVATADSSEQLTARPVSRELFVAFWGSAMVLAIAVFLLTSVSANSAGGRYLVGAWAAAAALLGILATGRIARAALLVGVVAFCALNARSEIASGVTPLGVGPDQRVAGEIERFATAHGASIGYAGYWDAAPVTWETHLRIKLYPIVGCPTPAGLCPFINNQINTWYVPRANTRTFLLADTRAIELTVGSPSASFGRPIAEEALEGGFTIYVYSHDIAAALG
jgi:hypothetical protein